MRARREGDELVIVADSMPESLWVIKAISRGDWTVGTERLEAEQGVEPMEETTDGRG